MPSGGETATQRSPFCSRASIASRKPELVDVEAQAAVEVAHEDAHRVDAEEGLAGRPERSVGVVGRARDAHHQRIIGL